LLSQPKQEHKPIPIRQQSQDEDKKPARLKLGMEKINILTWEPDFAKSVYKPMFGVEPNINQNTQQIIRNGTDVNSLVHAEHSANTIASRTQQSQATNTK
jgi:hypothetical protein